MSPEEVLNEAERVFASGDVMGAERVLAKLWSDTTSAPPAVLHLLGVIHFRTRDFVGAERFLRRAIKAAPNDARHHAALGELLARARHFDHAANSFAEAARLDPKLLRVRLAYGQAAFRAERYGEVEQVARALLKEAASAEAWDMLSCALRELGKHKEAAAAAEEALKIEPGNAPASHSRAAAWTFMGRDKEALDTFEGLTAGAAATPALWYFQSRALINLKRRDEAAELLAEGLRRWPANTRLRDAYAELRTKAH